jgi:hypothetical protein
MLSTPVDVAAVAAGTRAGTLAGMISTTVEVAAVAAGGRPGAVKVAEVAEVAEVAAMTSRPGMAEKA